MFRKGFLTTSELLYEGSDFAAWRKKIGALISLHLHSEDADDVYDYDFLAGCHDGSDYELEEEPFQTAATTIENYVSKGLLDRVPDDIRKRPFQLVAHLEGLAKPLRLMDLPEVVRQRVYKSAFTELNHFHICTNINGYIQRDRIPALLHTSAKLRSEAIPTFYQTTAFRCAIRHGPDWKYDLSMIKTWAATVAHGNVVHMRHLRFSLSGGPGAHFWFDNNATGLYYDRVGSSAVKRRALDKHVAIIQTYCKAMRLKGESLIMAVADKPKLWEELQFKRSFSSSPE